VFGLFRCVMLFRIDTDPRERVLIEAEIACHYLCRIVNKFEVSSDLSAVVKR
jgi:hypothetical protein